METMTNGQFKSYIRLLMKELKNAEDENDAEKTKEMIKEIIDNLQTSLED